MKNSFLRKVGVSAYGTLWPSHSESAKDGQMFHAPSTAASNTATKSVVLTPAEGVVVIATVTATKTTPKDMKMTVSLKVLEDCDWDS